MLKIKDIISMLKDLYKSNLILENFFDVLLTIGAFSFCCNFFSKVGLSFVLLSGTLYLFDVAIGFVLLTFFTPTILILANLPVAYIKNIAKDIKQYKKDNKINEINSIENNSLTVTSYKRYYCNSNSNHNEKSSKMVRVRKK